MSSSVAPSTVAFTLALGKHARHNARLLRATFKAFYPEIPFYLIDEEIYARFARQKEAAHTGEMMALRVVIGYFLSLCFDRVIHLDADTLVLAPIPRLVEGREPVLFTTDVDDYSRNLPVAGINAGVLAASSPDFWNLWFTTLYSYLVPLIGNFFDQMALRILCMQQAMPYLLIPERETGDYYNLGYRDHPGEWRAEGLDLFKGSARVRIWHAAGDALKPSLSQVPEAVRQIALHRLHETRGLPDYEEENGSLRRQIQAKGEPFLAGIEALFPTFSTHRLEGFEFIHHHPPPGLFGSEAPAAWDILRTPTPGLFRRLLPHAPRYLYATEEARLYEPDVERYNRPRLPRVG